MGGLEIAGAWGQAWATLAAVVSTMTRTAAALFGESRTQRGEPDYLCGYDALAPVMNHCGW